MSELWALSCFYSILSKMVVCPGEGQMADTSPLSPIPTFSLQDRSPFPSFR